MSPNVCFELYICFILFPLEITSDLKVNTNNVKTCQNCIYIPLVNEVDFETNII